jgi:hypothetical protein
LWLTATTTTASAAAEAATRRTTATPATATLALAALPLPLAGETVSPDVPERRFHWVRLSRTRALAVTPVGLSPAI